MGRKPKLDHIEGARFVTAVCYKRYPVFEDERNCEIVVKWLGDFRLRTGARILGYVIMPDHVHLVVWPELKTDMGRAIGQCKGRAAKEIIAEWTGSIPHALRTTGTRNRSFRIWQEGIYVFLCPSVDQVREKIEYCHKNPVTRGLTAEMQEWKYSSYGWYNGASDAPLAMDSWG